MSATALSHERPPLCVLCHDRMNAFPSPAGDAVGVRQFYIGGLAMAHRCCADQEDAIFKLAYTVAAPPELQNDFARSKMIAWLSNATRGACTIEFQHAFSVKVRCRASDQKEVVAIKQTMHKKVGDAPSNVYDRAISLAHDYVLVKVAFGQDATIPNIDTDKGPVYFKMLTSSRAGGLILSLCWAYRNAPANPNKDSQKRISNEIAAFLHDIGARGIQSIRSDSAIRISQTQKDKTVVFSIGI